MRRTTTMPTGQKHTHRHATDQDQRLMKDRGQWVDFSRQCHDSVGDFIHVGADARHPW
jgi:hypothetical protein